MRSPKAPGDTAPDALRVQAELYRAMTPAEKARRVADLTALASGLALAGLRGRHPDAAEPELLLRLARIRLGEDLVAQAYGWRPARDDP